MVHTDASWSSTKGRKNSQTVGLAAVRSAMEQRIEVKPELSHGVHRYDVADFGMTQDEIRERFRDYIGRFDLTEKRSMETGEV